jgi:hypothetical protein
MRSQTQAHERGRAAGASAEEEGRTVQPPAASIVLLEAMAALSTSAPGLATASAAAVAPTAVAPVGTECHAVHEAASEGGDAAGETDGSVGDGGRKR